MIARRVDFLTSVESLSKSIRRGVPQEKKILDLHEQHVIDAEIDKLLAKGVIIPSSHEEGEFISPIFTREKKDGTFRLSLNLKCLNTHLRYQHFKMDSFNAVLNMVKPGCFIASINLKHAYHSVPIYGRTHSNVLARNVTYLTLCDVNFMHWHMK